MDIYGDIAGKFSKVVDGVKEDAGKSEIDKAVIADLRADVESLGAGLRSVTLEFAQLIEENDETKNQLEKANKALLNDFNIRADLQAEIWKLKQLFVDLTFCYLNPEMSKTLYADTNKDFKEIVGDDPEFIDKKESES